MNAKEKAMDFLDKAYYILSNKSNGRTHFISVNDVNNCLDIAINETRKETAKEIFKEIEFHTYHRDKKHFEFNQESTFLRIELLRKKYGVDE